MCFSAYHRVSTVISVPGPFGSAVEMVTIDPLDLRAAQDQDAAMHTVHPADGVASVSLDFNSQFQFHRQHSPSRLMEPVDLVDVKDFHVVLVVQV